MTHTEESAYRFFSADATKLVAVHSHFFRRCAVCSRVQGLVSAIAVLYIGWRSGLQTIYSPEEPKSFTSKLYDENRTDLYRIGSDHSGTLRFYLGPINYRLMQSALLKVRYKSALSLKRANAGLIFFWIFTLDIVVLILSISDWFCQSF